MLTFIQHDDLRILHKCSRKTHKGPLSHTQVPTLFFDGCIKREPIDRCLRAARHTLSVFQDVFASRGGSVNEVGTLERVPETGIVIDAEGVKVGPEGSAEEEWVLGDNWGGVSR